MKFQTESPLTDLLAFFSVLATVSSQEQRVLNPPQSSAIEDIPPLGFGTWNLHGNASDAVAAALKTGYRHIDCAAAYNNEKEVGKGINKGAEAAGLKRDEFWVTSKLWNDHHRPDLVAKGLNQTLSDLNLEYLDLYLMHWPVNEVDGKTEIGYLDTWRAMTELPSSKVRNIGICNFAPAQFSALIAAFPLNRPYSHQMELHPYLPQETWIATHSSLGIKVTAYSPLGNMNPTYDGSEEEVPKLLKHTAVIAIAEARNCTPAQVALAWGLRRGTAVIPKSAHAERIEENFETSLACVLDEDATVLSEVLPVKRFNNPSKSWKVDLFQGLEDA